MESSTKVRPRAQSISCENSLAVGTLTRRAYLGSPRTLSAMMLRWIWLVPPAMVPAKLRR